MASPTSIDLLVPPKNSSVADVASSTPHFSALLSQISERLTEDGVSVQNHRECIKAQHRLAKEHHRFVEALALMEQVQAAIGDAENSSGGGGGGGGILNSTTTATALHQQLSPPLQQAILSRKAHLRFAEALELSSLGPKQQLHRSETPSGADVDDLVMGMEREDLLAACGLEESDLKKCDPACRMLILEDIEKRLRKKCDDLTAFFDPKSAGQKHAVGVAANLAELIEQQQTQLEENRKLLTTEQSRSAAAYWENYKTLCRTLEIVARLQKIHKLTTQPEMDELEKEWLMVQGKALCLKLAVVKNDVRRDTYPPEAVAALKEIRHDLEIHYDELSRNCETEGALLRQYQSIGSEFESIAKEFAEVQTKLKEQTWALQRVAGEARE